MINLKQLLEYYQAKYRLDDQHELAIQPNNNANIEILLYGSFQDLEKSIITGFRMNGYYADDLDSEIDESIYFELTKAVIEGDYRYKLLKKTLLDKIVGGNIYLDIGRKEQPLVKDFRCINQGALKNLYKNGKIG
jgi:hypothetical protein